MTVIVKAKVVTGRGRATKLRSDDVRVLSSQIGKELLQGSLNLVSNKPLWIRKETAIYSTDDGHLYWHGLLNGLPVIVNRLIAGYPVHIYEIYSDIHLRDTLNLNDGDKVSLSINEDILDKEKNKNIKHILTWYLLWFCREGFYYKSDTYLRLLKTKPINNYKWRSLQM